MCTRLYGMFVPSVHTVYNLDVICIVQQFPMLFFSCLPALYLALAKLIKILVLLPPVGLDHAQSMASTHASKYKRYFAF